MTDFKALAAASVLAAIWSQQVVAQTEAAPEENVEESAILPSAEGTDGSEAQSMDIDCTEGETSCLTPLERPSTGPEQSSTTTGEGQAGATVPVEADP